MGFNSAFKGLTLMIHALCVLNVFVCFMWCQK